MKLALLPLAAAASLAACGGGSRTPTPETAGQRQDTGASTEAECSRGEPEPALRVASAAARPRFECRGKLEAVEVIQLDDTTSLRITHGGCAHYVMTYAFTVRGAVRDTADARFWLDRTVLWLRALPIAENHEGEIDQIVTALRTAASASTPYAYGQAIRASEMAQVWALVRRGERGVVTVEVVFDYVL